ncbi:PDDEXK nuclease domain-containing protein [Cellulosimicrobium cellulans]|uniref:PDDEXK nuclease domain-containing protein n=1 Tax=Cellulosimicrobium cellulans TaxID=1710 RepID=UPI0006872D86|nr:PDDEXK nuclease domain-containing protein [Cellulosimicrobium cellulans]
MTSSGGGLEPVGYAELLAELKARVRATQFRAARAANTEVLRLYWSVGRDILDRQRAAGWGSKVVTSLAADLQREFPDQRGWSRSNLLYMRRAAEAWRTEDEFVQQPVGRLPWGHVTVLLDRLTTREERDWYAARAAEYGWSRAVLEHQIKADLRRAVGAAPTNFTEALEAPDSELAQQLVKDPYVFEHLAMVERVAERDVEQALMDRLQDTMLELGRGMAFVGRQVRLTVPDDASDRVDEFYVDLLFFHVEQLRYVVVELKIGPFEPAHVGQLGTYVAIVDDQFRRPEIHAPTIGILLCTGKTGPTVRYALAGTRVPIAVADYQGLPEEARGVLPSAAELEAVIEDELDHRAEG